MALVGSRSKLLAILGLLFAGLALPFFLPDDLLFLLALGFVASIGAIGLNLVTGFAGQLSLGHAFFLAVGAYTAAALSGDPDGRVIGLGVTSLPIWLLAAGIVAALVGILVAPIATRLRGLYLAIVTLGLVLFGEKVFAQWDSLTGGLGVGRPAAVPELFGVRLAEDGVFFTREQKLYVVVLVLLAIFTLLARNLTRSKVGRAFVAVRDRDLAAAVIGVNLARYKLLAFAVSSFYAGCAGALLSTLLGFFDPSLFGLLLSVQYLAMVFIGGIGTISGSIMGAMFITLIPRVTADLPALLPFLSTRPDAVPNVFQVNTALYGLLIIGFLLFEPRGLFSLWERVCGLRRYWEK